METTMICHDRRLLTFDQIKRNIDRVSLSDFNAVILALLSDG